MSDSKNKIQNGNDKKLNHKNKNPKKNLKYKLSKPYFLNTKIATSLIQQMEILIKDQDKEKEKEKEKEKNKLNQLNNNSIIINNLVTPKDYNRGNDNLNFNSTTIFNNNISTHNHNNINKKNKSSININNQIHFKNQDSIYSEKNKSDNNNNTKNSLNNSSNNNLNQNNNKEEKYIKLSHYKLYKNLRPNSLTPNKNDEPHKSPNRIINKNSSNNQYIIINTNINSKTNTINNTFNTNNLNVTNNNLNITNINNLNTNSSINNINNSNNLVNNSNIKYCPIQSATEPKKKILTPNNQMSMTCKYFSTDDKLNMNLVTKYDNAIYVNKKKMKKIVTCSQISNKTNKSILNNNRNENIHNKDRIKLRSKSIDFRMRKTHEFSTTANYNFINLKKQAYKSNVVAKKSEKKSLRQIIQYKNKYKSTSNLMEDNVSNNYISNDHNKKIFNKLNSNTSRSKSIFNEVNTSHNGKNYNKLCLSQIQSLIHHNHNPIKRHERSNVSTPLSNNYFTERGGDLFNSYHSKYTINLNNHYDHLKKSDNNIQCNFKHKKSKKNLYNKFDSNIRVKIYPKNIQISKYQKNNSNIHNKETNLVFNTNLSIKNFQINDSDINFYINNNINNSEKSFNNIINTSNSIINNSHKKKKNNNSKIYESNIISSNNNLNINNLHNSINNANLFNNNSDYNNTIDSTKLKTNSNIIHNHNNIIEFSKLQINNANTLTIHSESDINEKIKVTNIEGVSLPGYSGNRRKLNQDAYFIVKDKLNNNINNCSEGYDYILAGICDGHGTYGHLVSDYIIKHLPNKFKNLYVSNRYTNTFNEIISRTCLLINDELINNNKIDTFLSGSTCNIIFIKDNKLYCSNIGDSKAIICRKVEGGGDNNAFKFIELSNDHHPNIKEEANRIIKNGGMICQYYDKTIKKYIGKLRVWVKSKDFPGLAVTRSIGDEIGKTIGIICEPEIVEYNLNKNDKFVIIGSDGIWEYISCLNCMNIVKEYYKSNYNCKGAINKLCDEAYKKWRKEEKNKNVDDITCVIIFFN